MIMITATDTDTDTDTDTALVTVLVLVGRILYITIPTCTCTVNWISQISNNNGFTAATTTTLPYLMDPELRSFSAATMSVRCSCFRRGLLRFALVVLEGTEYGLALAPQYPYGTSISSVSILYLNWDPSAIVDTFALLY